MRRVVAVGLALLLFPSVSGAWTTFQGDASRSGVVDIGEGPFDVISVFDVGYTVRGGLSATVIDTPHGLLFTIMSPSGSLGEGQFDCYIGRITNLIEPELDLLPTTWPCTNTIVESTPVNGEAIVGGYSHVHDLALVCIPTPMPGSVLYAVDPSDGEIVWEISPPDATDKVVNTNGEWMTGIWSCNGAAIDDATNEAVVLFQAENVGHHRLASIRLSDGSVNWSNSTWWGSAFDGYEGTNYQALGYFDKSGPLNAGVPFGVPVLVDSGILINAFMYKPTDGQVFVNPNFGEYPDTGGAVWFERGGDYSGKSLEYDGTYVDDTGSGGTSSISGAGWDDHIAVLVDSTVHIVHPHVQTSVAIPTGHYLGSNRVTASPCWYEDWLFVPLETHALILDPNGIREPVDWPGLDGGEIQQCLLTPDVEAYAVVARDRSIRSNTGTDLHDLVKIDLRTGHTISQIPLPLRGSADAIDDHIMRIDLDGQPGLLAWDRTGRFAILGLADEDLSPNLAVADEYPELGAPAIISIHPADNTIQHLIAWGDGSVSTLTSEREAIHEYLDEGTRIIHVTSIFEDGRTATNTTTVHYGVPEPADLNWLQQRFEPGELDTTWGVIGVFLVLFGAVITLISRRVGRSRIAKGLRELSAIRTGADDDRLRTLHELQQWHGVQEGRLLRGRLTEDQFRVLEGRGARLVRSLARTAMEPFAGDLSKAFAKKLDAAISDGFVDPAEVGQLRQVAAKEHLPAAKQRALHQLLDAWA